VDPGQVALVEVVVRLDHTIDEDLAISLIAPDGTSVTLFAFGGQSGDEADPRGGSRPGPRSWSTEKRANYFCAGGRILLGSPRRSGRVWTIDSMRSARFLQTGARPRVHRVRIDVAWW
jgi:hypothetical protein